MGSKTDPRSDVLNQAISQQFRSFKTKDDDEEDDARKEQIRLLKARSSGLLDTFNDTSNTLGG